MTSTRLRVSRRAVQWVTVEAVTPHTELVRLEANGIPGAVTLHGDVAYQLVHPDLHDVVPAVRCLLVHAPEH